MNCPSQAPQTGPGPKPRAPSSSGRGRGWETAFCAHVVHVVPPYVLTPGRPSHPHVRLAGQAPSPFDGPTVLPIKTRSEPGLGFRLLLHCLGPHLPSSEVEETSATPPSPGIIGEVMLSSCQAQWGLCLFPRPPSFRVHWRGRSGRRARHERAETLCFYGVDRRGSQNASLHSRGWKSHTWGPPRR